MINLRDLYINVLDLIQITVPIIGGKGGGGNDSFAMGGGSDLNGVKEVFEVVKVACKDTSAV